MNRSALNFRHSANHLRRQGDPVDMYIRADANLEIGATTHRVHGRRAPAPLLHNIRGSLSGARIPGAPAGPRVDGAHAYSRLALHFGCRSTAGYGTSWPHCVPRCARDRSRHVGWSAG